MKLWHSVCICLLLICGYTVSFSKQLTYPGSSKAVPLGIYVADISNIDFKLQTIDVIFWVWSIQDKIDEKLGQELVLTNAVNQDMIKQSVKKLPNGQYSNLFGYKATLHQHFNVNKFPLDDQVVSISVENVDKTISIMHFVPDIEGSYVDKGADYLPGWKIGRASWQITNKQYGSAERNEKLGKDVAIYSTANYSIELIKQPLRSVINTFGITFLTFILGVCIFLVPPTLLQVRMSLFVASVFAIVGNQIALQSSIPVSNEVMLVDKIFLLAVISLVINLFLVFFIHYYQTLKPNNAKLINRIGLGLNIGCVPLICLIIILTAMMH
ncbi:hypothetical protein OAO18_05520 [Francisellaceae bacterium]|nr:hypothetical protein [Francisellaceae bacterium]